jgi:hypothetical protein
MLNRNFLNRIKLLFQNKKSFAQFHISLEIHRPLLNELNGNIHKCCSFSFHQLLVHDNLFKVNKTRLKIQVLIYMILK